MFFSVSVKPKLNLLIEVQSSLVRGSLVLYEKSKAPQFIHVQEIDIGYKPHAGGTYFVRTALRDLKEIFNISLRRLHAVSNDPTRSIIPKRVDEVHFILSSPWIVSQTRTLAVSFEKKTEITKERVHRMLSEERTKIDFEHEAGVEVVEEKIFDVKLNGYSIVDWQGKNANKIEISYALSIGNSDLIAKFGDLAAYATGVGKISIHSALILQYLYLRDLETAPYSYAIVYVHDELTDVMIVERQSCAFFGSFPIGIDTIVRKISDATGIDNKSAESLFSLYVGNHIDKEQDKKLASVMKKISEQWTDGLKKIFGMRHSRKGLPENIPENIFVVASAHETFFNKCLPSVKSRIYIKPLPEKLSNIYVHAIHNAG